MDDSYWALVAIVGIFLALALPLWASIRWYAKPGFLMFRDPEAYRARMANKPWYVRWTDWTRWFG